jgi:WD40 repeat protein
MIGVDYSPDGRSLAVADGEPLVQIWDTVRRQPRVTLPSPGEPLIEVKYSRDGRTLATIGNRGTLMLWDADQGVLRSSLPLEQPDVVLPSLTFSADSSKVLQFMLSGPYARVVDVATS